MPGEVIAFTDCQMLFEMIFVVVLCQDQAPGIFTSCGLVRAGVLICARLFEDRVNHMSSVAPEAPFITLFRAVQASVFYIYLPCELIDIDVINGVAVVVVIYVVSAIGVGLAVERYCLAIADRESRVDCHLLANGQIQTVELPVICADRVGMCVLATLASADTMPYKRYGLRTNGSNGIDRIHVVNRQDQHVGDRTSAAVIVVIVNARCLIRAVFPVDRSSRVERINGRVYNRLLYMQRQDNGTVTTALLEGMGVCAAFV